MMHNTKRVCNKSLRIAFVGAEGVPYPNAFAKISEEIGVRLVERGHEVVVYCRSRYVRDGTPYRGIRRIVLPSINTKHLDTMSFTFFSILDLLVRHNIDIVHIHGIGPSVFALLPRLKGIKSVVHVHALDWQRAKWGFLAKAYLRASEYSAVYFPNTVVVVSQTLKKYLENKFGKQVRYIPQGVDATYRREPNKILKLGLQGDDYTLFMGRLVPEKGCHYLIKAYEEMNTDKKLVIAGGSAHTDDYAASLQQAQSSQIIFVGHVAGELKEELLSNAYIYVQPSEMEGLSLALLEAMSYGNCVVVSDIPENLEAVRGCGYTFQSRNYEDLRRILETLLGNPQLVAVEKARARDYVQATYSWNLVSGEFERLYLSLFDDNYSS